MEMLLNDTQPKAVSEGYEPGGVPMDRRITAGVVVGCAVMFAILAKAANASGTKMALAALLGAAIGFPIDVQIQKRTRG